MKKKARINPKTNTSRAKLSLIQRVRVRALKIAANRIRKGRIEKKGMKIFRNKVK